MKKSNGINILDSNAKHGIVSEIDTREYRTLHIARIQAIKTDNNALKLGVAIFDRLGTFMLGVAVTIAGAIFLSPEITQFDLKPYYILAGFCLVIGVGSTAWGIYLAHNRDANIDSFIDDALNSKLDPQHPSNSVSK